MSRNPHQPFSDESIDRFLSKELPPDLMGALQGELESTPAQRGFLAGIRASVRSEWLTQEMSPVDDAKTRMFTRIDEAERASVLRSPARVTRIRWDRYAALFAGCIVLALGWFVGGSHAKSGMATQMWIYTTAYGERATVTLPDGSTASLNSGSRLSVSSSYGVRDRTLVLEGEALFTVVPEARRPFVVTAGNSMTRVLGTTFVVRHYADDTVTNVAVQDGKVVVGDVVVNAQERALVSLRGDVTKTHGTPLQLGFASGIMTLPSMMLVEAIPELNRWYNVDIRLGDARISANRIRGDFTTGDISGLAEILTTVFDLRVVRDGRTLTLYPRL